MYSLATCTDSKLADALKKYAKRNIQEELYFRVNRLPTGYLIGVCEDWAAEHAEETDRIQTFILGFIAGYQSK